MKRRVDRHAVTQPSDPSYKIIPLTRGKNALVDATDYDWLNQWNWYAHLGENKKAFYAQRSWRPKGGKTPAKFINMHIQILGLKSGEEGDHRNHDTLDNRRKNLRECTHLENCRNRRKRLDNSSGSAGVCWHKRLRKWQARICLEGKYIHLGYYSSKDEATRARVKEAKKHYGEFFPKRP
jgi:hypothetical protein